MFEQWPSLIARNPTVRRTAIKLWRVLLRMQRATLAKAVLVVRERDGRIFVLRSPSGALELPVTPIDAWVPITTQIEAWLARLLQQSASPSLVAVDGTPGREGVTFLYAARLQCTPPESEGALWLEPDVAALGLDQNGSRLLALCTDRAP
jgi:hypothetical protein